MPQATRRTCSPAGHALLQASVDGLLHQFCAAYARKQGGLRLDAATLRVRTDDGTLLRREGSLAAIAVRPGSIASPCMVLFAMRLLTRAYLLWGDLVRRTRGMCSSSSRQLRRLPLMPLTPPMPLPLLHQHAPLPLRLRLRLPSHPRARSLHRIQPWLPRRRRCFDRR